MKHLTPALIALSSVLLAAPASAKVDVYTKGPAERNTPWEQTFKGTNKGQNSDTNTAATLSQDSISNGKYGEGFPSPAANGAGIIQTFVGDGKQLEGIGFALGPIKEKITFTLAFVDYGTKSPKNAADIKAGKILFVERGTLAKSSRTQQYYFDLSNGGERKLVLPVLIANNTYGVQLNISGNEAPVNFYRSTSVDAYEKGVAGIYKDGEYSMLGIGKKGPADLRKINFAIYTAPAVK